jgi:hypothetical protein
MMTLMTKIFYVSFPFLIGTVFIYFAIKNILSKTENLHLDLEFKQIVSGSVFVGFSIYEFCKILH